MRLFKAMTIAAAGIVLVGTLLPLIRTHAWWVRIFDFTHLQVTVLGILVITALIFLWGQFPPPVARALLATVVLATLGNVWWLLPYTRVAAKQVMPASRSNFSVSVLAVNVLQGNRDSGALLEEIHRTNPDVILVTEVDDRWTRELSGLTKTHPYTVLHPLNNTYGINLYSRLPLSNPEVRYLTEPKIPSIRTHIELNGQKILFYGVHPRPPGRPPEGEATPSDSTHRDAELVLVAREIQDVQGPVIVAGDFNDVAWSHTSRMFRRISRLLDPRVGRGFFNTFHAKLPVLRFPLDHLFHSDEFTLIEMQRLGKIGSDHFPIYARLQLDPAAAPIQEAPPPKESDSTEARETLQEARQASAEHGRR